MKNPEIRDILSRGATNTYSFDPNIKSEITRIDLDRMMKDVKGHLLKKKGVTVLVVKQ